MVRKKETGSRKLGVRKWVTAAFLLGALSLLGQGISTEKDSTVFQLDLSLMGSRHTGNLNQIGVSPNGKLTWQDGFQKTTAGITYSYLEVEGFTVLNDYWSHAEFRVNPQQKWYPLLTVIYGFAYSYKINHAFISGGGIGYTPLPKDSKHFLELSAFAGYMDFEFIGEAAHQAPTWGTLFTYQSAINSHLNVEWIFKSYHSTSDGSQWGVNNNIALLSQIVNNLNLKFSYNWLYNDAVVPGVEKTNSMMMLGVQYSLR